MSEIIKEDNKIITRVGETEVTVTPKSIISKVDNSKMEQTADHIIVLG